MRCEVPVDIAQRGVEVGRAGIGGDGAHQRLTCLRPLRAPHHGQAFAIRRRSRDRSAQRPPLEHRLEPPRRRADAAGREPLIVRPPIVERGRDSATAPCWRRGRRRGRPRSRCRRGAPRSPRATMFTGWLARNRPPIIVPIGPRRLRRGPRRARTGAAAASAAGVCRRGPRLAPRWAPRSPPDGAAAARAERKRRGGAPPRRAKASPAAAAARCAASPPRTLGRRGERLHPARRGFVAGAAGPALPSAPRCRRRPAQRSRSWRIASALG